MAKDKIFSKIAFKNYNNQLEEIIEKKKFTEDTKNLLLSMLYKIENAYADYQQVKRQVPSKREFIENLLETIKNHTREIKLLKHNTIESKMLENIDIPVIVDREHGSIVTYPNEMLLLYGLSQLEGKRITFNRKERKIEKALREVFLLGSIMSDTEVIRDFNGWSWDTTIKDIESIGINQLYTIILYLVGYPFLRQCYTIENQTEDIINKIKAELYKKYEREQVIKLLENFYKIATELHIQKDTESESDLKKEKEIRTEQLQKLEKKAEFLQEITNLKKEVNNRIKNIDTTLNNSELLKKEYKERNEKLANKDKFFSISHLADQLEKERENCLRERQEYNDMLDPKGYVNKKQEIEKQVEFLNNISFKGVARETWIIFHKEFLECISKSIKKWETKKEILDGFYLLRYYGYLPWDKQTKIKEIEELKEDYEKVFGELIQKAYKHKVLENTFQNEKIPIMAIMGTSMITLESMVILLKNKEENVIMEIYDTTIFECRIQLQLDIREDLEKKLDKKIKLFL